MLQGQYGGLERDKPLLRMSLAYFTLGTVFLPLFGFIICVILSLLYHFNEATYTHCEVPNYLPSISAAISLQPERYIWRFCISLHSAPRFLLAGSYYTFYRIRFTRQRDQILSIFTFLCAISENIGLLLLTYVCSTEAYNIHKYGFIAFISSSLIHMMCTCRLWHTITKHSVSAEESTFYRYKLRLLLFSIGCCLLAGYFFRRHNKYCEPGIYTLFALCEYLVVLANMAFHTSAFWDFGSMEVMVAMPFEGKHI